MTKKELAEKQKLTTPELIADLNDWIEEASMCNARLDSDQTDYLMVSVKAAADRLHRILAANAKLREANRELREVLEDSQCLLESLIGIDQNEEGQIDGQINDNKAILARHPEQKEQE